MEGIPKFSTVITEVKRVSDNIYLWKMEINGIALEWNSVIVKKEEAKYLSWRSISGLENRGEYLLESQDGKTKVSFFMEYHLPSRIIEAALHMIFDKLVEETYVEILANIKKALEEGHATKAI